MSETGQFLEALFADKPERAAVQVWIRDSRSLTWFLSDLGLIPGVIEKPAKRHDVYIGCGLAPEAHDRAQNYRTKAHEVVGIPGVWADIDVNGGPEGKEGAAPDMDAAMELASTLLEPTLLVHSGYGLQAWWLWEDGPWMFEHRQDQEQARRIITGFQGALKAAARRAGWGLDATQDLARVMRLPGTFNHKDKGSPAPVRLIALEGRRYAVEEVGELGQGYSVANVEEKRALENGEAFQIEVRHRVPLDHIVTELQHKEPEFAQLWAMKKGVGAKRRDWSLSEFELAICNWMVRAGLRPQQIADAIVAWRDLHEPGDPRGKLRPERLARTIGKAMSVAEDEDFEALVEKTQEMATQTLRRIASSSEPPNEAKALKAFNDLIGGPELARLYKNSRDPKKARYTIELADGRKVPIGPIESLTSHPTFSRIYANVTEHYPPPLKGNKWHGAVAGLLKVAVVNDEMEDSSAGEMEMWIEEYLETAGSPDRDGAAHANAPFRDDDGVVHVSLQHFLRYLRRMGEKIERADLSNELRSMGYDRKVISFKQPDGNWSTRSYFVGA